MRKLEVRRLRRKTPVAGYIDPIEEDVQQLGYYAGRKFVVVEEEIIPADIVISRGAFGDPGRSWISKFTNWIPEKNGGQAEQFEGPR